MIKRAKVSSFRFETMYPVRREEEVEDTREEEEKGVEEEMKKVEE